MFRTQEFGFKGCATKDSNHMSVITYPVYKNPMRIPSNLDYRWTAFHLTLAVVVPQLTLSHRKLTLFQSQTCLTSTLKVLIPTLKEAAVVP